jgi:hypothetical protein
MGTIPILERGVGFDRTVSQAIFLFLLEITFLLAVEVACTDCR